MDRFRYDINALRCVAVMSVVLFHFQVAGLGGGFQGVDIFFVISGYLMTEIIMTRLEADRFSLLDFYAARATRIIPALIGLCVILAGFGWVYLAEGDFLQLLNHASSSLLFYSNQTYSQEAGYFNAESHEKWLLHTWSLSAEWQFYLIYPLLALVLWKLLKSAPRVMVALLFLSLASLAFSVHKSLTDAEQYFFLLPVRAWEMFAGGLVWGLSRRLSGTAARGLAITGYALILLGLVAFDANDLWPGWRALVPVAGTCLVLLAARQDPWMRNGLIQWAGLRSYSIYLWHWPVVVFLAYEEQLGNPMAVCLGIALAFLLGELSYRLVENRSRDYLARKTPRFRLVAILIVVGILAGTLRGIILIDEHSSTPSLARQAAAEAKNRNPRRDDCLVSSGTESPGCRYGGEKIRLIVAGDSHADAMVTAVESSLPAGAGLLFYGYAGCPIVDGAKRFGPKVKASHQCDKFNTWLDKRLTSLPKGVPLLIIQRTNAYIYGHNEKTAQPSLPLVYFDSIPSKPDARFLKQFDDRFLSTVCRYAVDRPVYLLDPVPELGTNVPRKVERLLQKMRRNQSPTDFTMTLDAYNERNAHVFALHARASQSCAVKSLDIRPYLCPDGQCLGSKNGRPLYFDDDHLSEFGNRFLVPLFKKIFDGGQTP
ncbi:acyltransferase family protein [Perlucidibaca piscinae]|uniref:acyltransferase family protein n=1 Tax=Perlucidibaca piscinae TaxID=392589 RepID=UPI0003B5A70A|nr:acyltransferase family protein [Perlucidibaca piscinae]